MIFKKRSVIQASPSEVFTFHERLDAFEMLIPPWETVKVIQKADISVIGSRAIIETSVFGPIKVKWVAEHTKYDPPRLFEDVQISGPFKYWRHQHIVEPHQDGAILLDEIEFTPPFWYLGKVAAQFVIIPKLEKMFEYRHRITKEFLESQGK